MPRCRTSLALMLLVGALASAGCAPVPGHGTRTFEPGASSSTHANVRVELREAIYAPRNLTLEIVVTNLGAQPLTIRRDGLLLEDGKLELPALNRPESPLSETMEVPAGDSLALGLPFASSARAGAVLRLRALERGGVTLDFVDLPIPGPPPPAEQT